MVISDEMYETRQRLVSYISYEMTTSVRFSISRGMGTFSGETTLLFSFYLASLWGQLLKEGKGSAVFINLPS